MADPVISQTDYYLKSVTVKLLSDCNSENLVCFWRKRREICELNYLWRWGRFEILYPIVCEQSLKRSKQDNAWPLPGLGTLLVSIHWIPDTFLIQNKRESKHWWRETQKRQGLREVAVNSWWKRSIHQTRTNSVCFLFLFIFKCTKCGASQLFFQRQLYL